jgi:hypothetical protein
MTVRSQPIVAAKPVPDPHWQPQSAARPRIVACQTIAKPSVLTCQTLPDRTPDQPPYTPKGRARPR